MGGGCTFTQCTPPSCVRACFDPKRSYESPGLGWQQSKALTGWTGFSGCITGSAGSGPFPGGDAQCTMSMEAGDFVKMFKGQLNPTQAFMGGKLKLKGDMMLAMKLEKLIGNMKSKQGPRSYFESGGAENTFFSVTL